MERRGNLRAIFAQQANLNAPIIRAGGGALTTTAPLVNVGIFSPTSKGLIQNAVDMIPSGGLVKVAPGTYEENNITITGKSVTVRGSGARSTTVDGTNTGRVFNIDAGGQTVKLEDMLVTRGYASSASGGGIYIQAGNVEINNSIISGNDADGYGSGIQNLFGATLKINNSAIVTNLEAIGGGGIANGGTLTIHNSTVSGNRAGNGGGSGIYNTRTLIVSNSTISDNNTSAVGTGGGIYNDGGSSSTTITSSIIAGNTVASGSGPNVYGSFIDGGNNLVGNTSGSTGFGTGPTPSSLLNITNTSDIGLAPLGDYGGPTPTHALLSTSLALGAGANPLAFAYDQRGFARTVGGLTDIGAYQVQTSYVVRNTGDYAAAQPRVEHSLRAALSYAVLQPVGGAEQVSLISFAIPTTDSGYNVGTGIWTVTRAPGAGAYTITSGLTVDGTTQTGYTGTQPLISLNANGTVGGGSVFALSGGTLLNPIRLIGLNMTNANSSSGGITVSGGYAEVDRSTITNNTGTGSGGGIWANGAHLTVTNSTFSGNSAFSGGGVYVTGGTIDITGSIFSNNHSTATNRGGAGLYVNSGIATVSDSTFRENTSLYLGGAIFNLGTLTITNSVIHNNTAEYGAGVFNQGTRAVTNTDISGNSAAVAGGGLYLAAGTLTISNSTLRGNQAIVGGGIANYAVATIINTTIGQNTANNGGGIFNNGTVTILNSTISENTAALYGGGITVNGTSSVTITSSIIAGNTVDAGGVGPNVINNVIDGGNNLIGDTSGSTGFGTGPTPSTLLDKTMAEIGLAPLGNYGGPTLTYGLLPGSLALNAGSNPLGLTTDQRGLARTVGGLTDIGAFESLGYTYSFTGSGQSAELMSAFGQPLSVTITSPETWFNSALILSLGLTTTITVPGTGASATGTLTQAFDGNGTARFYLTANRTAGTYHVGIAGTGLADAFTLANTPLQLIISPDAGQGKAFREADPSSYLYTITGGSLLSGDFLTGTLSRVAGEDPGLYSYLPGTLGNPNYTLTFVPGLARFTILAAILPPAPPGPPAPPAPPTPQPEIPAITFADPNVPWWYIQPKSESTHTTKVQYAPPSTALPGIESSSSYKEFQGGN